METPKDRAMLLQRSPSFTTYSRGGSGVSVGPIVGSSVAVGVRVSVGVVVRVGVTVGVVTRPVDCRITKINAAPRPRTRTMRPMAAGRLIFNSGNFGFWTGLVSAFLVGVVVKVRPHTRHLVAFSLNLVPQVGHVFGVDEVFSVVIEFFYI